MPECFSIHKRTKGTLQLKKEELKIRCFHKPWVTNELQSTINKLLLMSSEGEVSLLSTHLFS